MEIENTINGEESCCKFIEIIENSKEAFNLLDEFKMGHIKYKVLKRAPLVKISPKDFLGVINSFYQEDFSNIYLFPKDISFKKAIEKINSKTNISIEEAGALLLYSIIKSKSFEDKTIKTAIISFLYLLFKNNYTHHLKKETFVLICLLIEKSTKKEMKSVIDLTVKLIAK